MIFLFLAGILLSMRAASYASGRTGAVKSIVCGLGLYISLYIITSGILFTAGEFTLFRAAGGTVIAAILSLVFMIIMAKGKRPIFMPFGRDDLTLLIILVISFVISAIGRSGSYDTGQDEGLYQIRAEMYISGQNENLLKFHEYPGIADTWEQQEYLRLLEDMDGLYMEEEGPEDRRPYRISGVLHGINTFPALLAIFGKLFGLAAMAFVPVICYTVTVGNVWLFSRRLGFGSLYSSLAAIVFALSPIEIWAGRNTLNEIVMAMFVTLFFLLYDMNHSAGAILLSAIPLCAVCFMHVTITIMMPMLVIIYLCGYLVSGMASHLAACSLLAFSYAAGFSQMYTTGRTYVLQNFANIFTMTKELVNEDNLGAVISGAAGLAILVCLILYLAGRKGKIRAGIKKIAVKKSSAQIFKVLTVVWIIIYVLVIVKQTGPFLEWVSLSDLFILGFLMMSGFIFFPVAVIVSVIRGGSVLKDRTFFALSFSMYYITLVLCGIMWVMVREYFYFARYLAPYIFLPIILAGYLLKRFPARLLVPVCVIAAGVMVFQGRILFQGADKTSCSYKTLEEIASCIDEDDALVINDQGYNSSRVFALQLRALTGADLYFMNSDKLERQTKRLLRDHSDVYVLSYDLGSVPKEEDGWRYVYRGVTGVSQYEVTKEEGLRYPDKLVTNDVPTALLIYEGRYLIDREAEN